MNTPCAIDTPEPRVVETFSSPGNIAETTAAAHMPASICEMKQRIARVVVIAPMR
jgi:hypothetical protein